MSPEASPAAEQAGSKRDHDVSLEPPANTDSAGVEGTDASKRQRHNDSGDVDDIEGGSSQEDSRPEPQAMGADESGPSRLPAPPHRPSAGKTVGAGKRYGAQPARRTAAGGASSDGESGESMSDGSDSDDDDDGLSDGGPPPQHRPGRGKGGGKMFSSKMLARKALSVSRHNSDSDDGSSGDESHDGGGDGDDSGAAPTMPTHAHQPPQPP
ncbi:hypothetical protein H4R19_005820, partial [Coemansia spiralis]